MTKEKLTKDLKQFMTAKGIRQPRVSTVKKFAIKYGYDLEKSAQFTILPFHKGDIIAKKSKFKVIDIKGKEDKLRLLDIETGVKITVRISEVEGYKIVQKATEGGAWQMDAREKLETLIDGGKSRVETVLTDIQREFAIRKDTVVKPSSIKFQILNNENSESPVRLHIEDTPYNLTPHSFGQLCGRAQIPELFLKKVIGLNENDLAMDTLNTMNKRLMKDGVLLRHLPNEGGYNTVKGLLSPSYRRMDASPIFESFIKSSLKAGFVPYNGFNSEYRYQLRFIHPEIYQPAEKEFVVYGVGLTTGDYGNQSLQMEMIALRIWCSNLAIGMDIFRKIHLGKRFVMGDDDIMELSNKTYALDGATMASAVSDVAQKAVEFIPTINEKVTAASLTVIDIDKRIKSLKKKGIGKELAEEVKTIYNSDGIFEMLPEKKNLWRLSNAISLLAETKKEISADKRIDLQSAAMDMICSN